MKKTGLTAALEVYTSAAYRLAEDRREYKALPAEIAIRTAELESCRAECAAAEAALTKPYDTYTTKWEGSNWVPSHEGARRVYTLRRAAEWAADRLVGLKAQKKSGLAELIQRSKDSKDAAAAELFNAANLAAARMKIKTPLCKDWERLSIVQIKERLAPLAEAESTWQAEKKSKRAAKAEAEAGTEARLHFGLIDGGAEVFPAEMYNAVKVASKSKSDYILLGRGVLLPAKPLIDWLRIIAKDTGMLTLSFDAAKKEMITMIGRSKALFKGLNWSEYPAVFPWEVYTARCTHRVIMDRAR